MFWVQVVMPAQHPTGIYVLMTRYVLESVWTAQTVFGVVSVGVCVTQYVVVETPNRVLGRLYL